ncbi:hypothetical protein AXF42_Ash021528 [Apostasia shenzhenica]|uniref:Uncharacterized protein n=1 Tax=Apostasia shenzhenica TaxID=1088818 RepID=A0A2H9ZV00_9ASPA|nr:hypothetical protein AXF42_Ash021528 [Apostasia shenzhenica]
MPMESPQVDPIAMLASQIAELEKHVSSRFETIERKFDALSSRVILLEKRQSDNYEINTSSVSKFMENPTTIREESLSFIEADIKDLSDIPPKIVLEALNSNAAEVR